MIQGAGTPHFLVRLSGTCRWSARSAIAKMTVTQKLTQLPVSEFIVLKVALEECDGRVDEGCRHAHGF